MSSLKKLASQTAYYGLSSILGRMLFYALVPLHTRVLHNQQDYGVIGELYAYVTFLNIIFLYGMETTFFRFANKSDDVSKVYSTSFFAVTFSSIVLTCVLFLFANPIYNLVSIGTHNSALYKIEYIYMLILIMGLDAITAIPFAKLRLDNRPIKFAAVRIANISINVFFNVYFLVICPWILKENPTSIFASFYHEDSAVYYIFLANVIAAASTLLFLYKEIICVKLQFARKLLKPMLIYAVPLLFAGLAGMINETLDRILLKYYLPGTLESRLTQIGIYNAAYKLSIFMTLATQAFRMGAEPFFFSISKDINSKDTYAKVMRFYVIVCCIIFLAVMTHIKLLEQILGPAYREGLFVVPVLLLANLFFGIYLNLSIWYKLSDKTSFGIYFTLLGAAITILLNILWIPHFGFVASAYATLICYFVMMVSCYFVGQKYFQVNYFWKNAAFYLGLMLAFYFLDNFIKNYENAIGAIGLQFISSTLFAVFVLIAYKKDFKSILKKNTVYGD